MSASVEVVTYPATVSVVDSAVAVSVVSQVVSVEAGSSGPQGVAGPTGATGATGAAGSSGVVSVVSPITNSGSASAAVLGFDQTAQDTTNDTRYARLGAANAFTVGGHTITNAAAGTIPLQITAATSQTANLTEWRVSPSVMGARIANGGFFHGTGFRIKNGADSTISGVQGSIETQGPTIIGAVIRGAASQTANLQEWQNSAGSVLANLNSAGVFFAVQLRTTNTRAMLGEDNVGGYLQITRQNTATLSPGANIGRLYFRDGTTAGTLKLVVRAGTAGAETTILDNIPQT